MWGAGAARGAGGKTLYPGGHRLTGGPPSLLGSIMTASIENTAHGHDYPPSYFAATAHAAPFRPALEGVKQVDVCVIGGGFTGLSAALHGAERGLSCVLLESRRIGWGASGMNSGQVMAGWTRASRSLVHQLGAARARQLFELAAEAVAQLWLRIGRHGIDCDARKGHLIVAATPQDMAMLEAEAECREAVMGYGYSRFVDRKAAVRLTGSESFHGGLLDAEGGHVHPLNLALGLARAAELAGARLHEGSRVIRVRARGARMLVETMRGKVLARHVVVAGGAQSGRLLERVKRRTEALSVFAAATEPLPADVAATLVKDGLAVCDTRMAANSFHMTPDRRLVFGGGERFRLDPEETPESIVRPRLEAVYPQLKGVRLDHGWSGLVTVTSSRMPAIGREGQIYYAAGYSGQGVAQAFLAGGVIAEAIGGDTRRFDLISQLPNLAVPGGRWLRLPIFAAIGALAALREVH